MSRKKETKAKPKDETMNIQTLAIEDVHEAPYNPRIDLKPGDKVFEDIKRSIETFGYVEPIVVNSDGTIIGGHQRFKVLKEMGHTSVEAVVVSLDKAQERALNLALNKIVGDWDYEKLEATLKELQAIDFDISLTGFTDAEIFSLTSQAPGGLDFGGGGGEPGLKGDDTKAWVVHISFQEKEQLERWLADIGIEREVKGKSLNIDGTELV